MSIRDLELVSYRQNDYVSSSSDVAHHKLLELDGPIEEVVLDDLSAAEKADIKEYYSGTQEKEQSDLQGLLSKLDK